MLGTTTMMHTVGALPRALGTPFTCSESLRQFLCAFKSTAQAHWSHLIPGKPGEPQEPEEPWPQDKAGWRFCRKDYPHSLPGMLSLVPNLWFQFFSWDNPPHEDPQVANVQLVLSLSDHVPLVESWLAASSRDSVKFHLPLTPSALSS